MRRIKTFTELLNEAATWDDTSRRYIDRFFVSFDPKEKGYEVRDFINATIAILENLGKEVDHEELSNQVWECKDKIAHNHPRRALLKCVLKNYDVEIDDIEK